MAVTGRPAELWSLSVYERRPAELLQKKGKQQQKMKRKLNSSGSISAAASNKRRIGRKFDTKRLGVVALHNVHKRGNFLVFEEMKIKKIIKMQQLFAHFHQVGSLEAYLCGKNDQKKSSEKNRVWTRLKTPWTLHV
jgi:hypothetical protein